MSAQEKKFPPYWRDDRTQTQINLMQKLAQKLSLLNHQRKIPPIKFQNLNNLFITVGGVPPNPNQFNGLRFPGKVLNYRPPFFDRSENKIDENKEEKLFKVSMDNTCQEINSLIEKNGFNEAILVYHSFGGSIVAWFCSKYRQKVKGLICLGGTPIRFYPILRDYAKAYLSIPNISREFIIQNYELVYSLYDQKTKNHKNWNRFQSKEELLSFTLHNDPITLNNLFDKIRALPLPILMIYGNNDEVLTKTLCSQAMVTMSYQPQSSKKLNQTYEKSAKRFVSLHPHLKRSEDKQFNLQEKFVYFIDGGHSIHISQKNNKKIQPLIDQYLYTILDEQAKKVEDEKQARDFPLSKSKL